LQIKSVSLANQQSKAKTPALQLPKFVTSVPGSLANSQLQQGRYRDMMNNSFEKVGSGQRNAVLMNFKAAQSFIRNLLSGR